MKGSLLYGRGTVGTRPTGPRRQGSGISGAVGDAVLRSAAAVRDTIPGRHRNRADQRLAAGNGGRSCRDRACAVGSTGHGGRGVDDAYSGELRFDVDNKRTNEMEPLSTSAIYPRNPAFHLKTWGKTRTPAGMVSAHARGCKGTDWALRGRSPCRSASVAYKTAALTSHSVRSVAAVIVDMA